MDTFMDKLAQKFTAQEMIKANTAAETEELERLRLQVQEYTDCLNRMQQICGEMDETAKKAEEKVHSLQFDSEGLKEQLFEILQNMEVKEGSDGCLKELQGMKASQESCFDEMKANQESCFGEMKASQDSRLEEMKQSQEAQLDGLKSNLDQQLQGLRTTQGEQFEKIKGMQDAQLESFKQLQAEHLEGLKGMQDAQIATIRNSMEDQLDSMRTMVKAQMSGMKNGQDNQLSSIKSTLEMQSTAVDGKMNEMKQMLEEQLGGSNEFVHRECVKVYRNVQAVIGEENTKQVDNLEYTLKPMAGRIATVQKLSVFAIILSIVSIVLQILSVLHIF